VASTGSASAAQPIPAARAAAGTNLESHVRILGFLWIARGVLHAVGGFWLAFFGRVFLPRMMWFYPHGFMGFPLGRFLAGSLAIGGFIAILFGVADAIAGWALLQHEEWGRLLALVLGFITLISFPIGTALGIYTLVILLPGRSEEEYRRLARAV
jgi:hypothetical protein